jgi:hypothetical protein
MYYWKSLWQDTYNSSINQGWPTSASGGPHNSLRNRLDGRRSVSIYRGEGGGIEFTSAPLFINNDVTLNLWLNTLVKLWQIKMEDRRLKKRITIANRAYDELLPLLKSQSVHRAEKMKICKTLTKPVATYRV